MHDMTDFMDEFLKTYGLEVSQQLSSHPDIKQDTALKMLPIIAPMILSGLKRQAEQHGGSDEKARATRVNHILNKYGDASVLDHIGEEFEYRAQDTHPDPQLGGLLGDSGTQAADMISRQFNMDTSTAMKLIIMLAPVILGALTNKRDTGGIGSRGIASLIDQDGDDQILDDVIGFLLNSRKQMNSKNGSDLLGSLLGELMK
jgi:hypothetical protein